MGRDRYIRSKQTALYGAGRCVAGFTILFLALLVATWTGACGDDAAPVEASEPEPAAGTSVSTPVVGPTATTTQVTGNTTDTASMTTATEAGERVTTPEQAGTPATITIVYDNTAVHPQTRADWGFACLVEGFDKTVLFDTGADGGILLSNLEALGFAPQDIDVVVLSHDHRDHTGGLNALIAANPAVTVYYPASFSERTVARAREAGVALVAVEEAVSPSTGLTITAPQRGSSGPEESGLLVDTSKGQILVLGCSHPGVAEMVRAARDLTGRPVYAVLGGFHLMSHSQKQVDAIIDGLRELGVERCGPGHCTGEGAIARIQAAFGEASIGMGVGATLTGD